VVKFHCKHGVFPSVSFVNGYVHLKLMSFLSFLRPTTLTILQSWRLKFCF